MHQAHAIMYCTRQMIQGENFCDWLKNRENRESFLLESFAVYGMKFRVIYYNFIVFYVGGSNDSTVLQLSYCLKLLVIELWLGSYRTLE